MHSFYKPVIETTSLIDIMTLVTSQNDERVRAAYLGGSKVIC